MELQRGAVVGRYTIEAELGAGGMATVYPVRHTSLGTLHPLKVLHDRRSGLHERLVREGRLQGALRHPGVLLVTDLLDIDGAPALVLEYVDGPTLGDLLRDRRLSLEEADHLGRRILEAVAAAHRHDLVHRDLKPANVLVSVVDGVPQPKVADFGLAKLVEEDRRSRGLTESNASMGTPGYMSPEQLADSRSVDARADIFSLGAILFELVTGRRPFVGEHVMEIMFKVTKGIRPAVTDLAPDLPRRMVAAVEGALQPDVDARIQTTEELLAVWVGDAGEPSVRVEWARPEPVAEDDSVRGRLERVTTLQHADELLRSVAPPTGIDDHPPAHELFSRPDDPDVRRHLDSCAACRVDARLYAEEFEDEAPDDALRPGRGLAPAAAIVAVPFVYGVLVLLLGGADRVTWLGPWWPPIVGLAAVSAGVLVRAAVRLRRGFDVSPTATFLGPTLLLVVGLLGSGLGARMVSSVQSELPLGRQAEIVAWGVNIALTTRHASTALAALLGLGAAAAMAWAFRGHRAPDPTALGRARIGVGLALVGGAGLWAVDVLRVGASEAFLVFVVLVAVSGCGALVVTGGTPARRVAHQARRLLAVGAVVAVGGAAAAVRVQRERGLLRGTYKDSPDDQLAAAERFGAAVQEPHTLLVAWVLLAAAAAWVTTRGASRRRPPLRTVAGLAALGGAVLAVQVSMSAWERAAVQRIAPAFLNAAVDWYLPGAGLADAPGEADGGLRGVRVEAGSGPLRADDRVVALGEVPLDDVHGFVRQLRSCVCGARSESCGLPTCAGPGATLPATVLRPGDGPARLVTVELVLAMPEDVSGR